MDLDQAIDELYSVTPDDFVGERSRLAKGLRDGGQAGEAATLGKMRKPSVAAWALNQLSRGNRRQVDLLLDAGHRLREAQAAVLAGSDHDVFERAQAAEREAVSRLVRVAETLLKERGAVSASVLNQVADSLRIAAISPDGRELLARGRFTKPPVSQGFDLANELAAQTPRTAPAKDAGPVEQEERRRAKQAVRTAQASLRAAEREARDARRDAERVSRQADQARERVAEAERRVEAATKAVDRGTGSIRAMNVPAGKTPNRSFLPAPRADERPLRPRVLIGSQRQMGWC